MEIIKGGVTAAKGFEGGGSPGRNQISGTDRYGADIQQKANVK